MIALQDSPAGAFQRTLNAVHEQRSGHCVCDFQQLIDEPRWAVEAAHAEFGFEQCQWCGRALRAKVKQYGAVSSKRLLWTGGKTQAQDLIDAANACAAATLREIAAHERWLAMLPPQTAPAQQLVKIYGRDGTVLERFPVDAREILADHASYGVVPPIGRRLLRFLSPRIEALVSGAHLPLRLSPTDPWRAQWRAFLAARAADPECARREEYQDALAQFDAAPPQRDGR